MLGDRRLRNLAVRDLISQLSEQQTQRGFVLRNVRFLNLCICENTKYLTEYKSQGGLMLSDSRLRYLDIQDVTNQIDKIYVTPRARTASIAGRLGSKDPSI
jgi:hypothetical protein